MSGGALLEAIAKMRGEGLPEEAIRTFAHAYRELAAGASGTLPDRDLEPAGDVPDAEELTASAGRPVLDRVVVVKLNGGLGTSMGMSGPKSLIEAREGLSFLDITVRQVLALRRRSGARVPLVLMNSFSTRAATLRALARHPELDVGLPLDFVQHREPRIRSGDLRPVDWPARRELEWCPPGHGDVYPALAGSGMLATLLDRGYEYAFVSNADNLGATLDLRLLEWFAAERVPFAMEVVAGTEADRKGGHIARRSDGRLVLRETVQTPPEDAASFRDFRRWRHYNTNNLWIDLRALAALLRERGGVMGLPLIVNRKPVDPADPSSPEVIQLETAMGAAIGAFDGARAVRVPRARFAPVKTTDDLLVLRSDVYRVAADGAVERDPRRLGGDVPFVDLDRAWYAHIDAFDRRFPAGPPSLSGAERLVVRGDVTFGRGVVVRGRVHVRADGDAPRTVPDGAVLEGDHALA